MKKAANIILWGVLLASVVGAAGAAAWVLRDRTETFYTDADAIREPVESASLRDVLWRPPLALAEPVNSWRDDYEARLSPDGATMLFVRGKAGEGADIFTSRRTEGGWSEPEPFDAVNSPRDDLGPLMSPDGSAVYFYSDRDGGLGGYDIWRCRRTGEGWGEPENLGPGVNGPLNDYGPALTPDGTLLLFASNRPRAAEDMGTDPEAWPATVREDLFRNDYDIYEASVGDRGFGRAALVEALSSEFNDGAPAVSPVGDFVYLASDRPGGMGGFDLYRARLVGDTIRPIEHLGAEVNSASNELDPALSMGGFELHFSSDRARTLAGGEARDDYDLYRTTSREVFRQDITRRAQIDWAGLLAEIWPWLLMLLLALALLVLLLKLASDERWRARWRPLSLMIKCLLLSVMAHALLMALLAFWQVTTSLEGLLDTPGSVKVSLVSRAVAGDIAGQIRGELTRVDIEPAEAPRTPASEVRLALSEVSPASLSPESVEIAPSELRSDRAPSDSAARSETPREARAEVPEGVDAAVATPDSTERTRREEAGVAVTGVRPSAPAAMPAGAALSEATRADLRVDVLPTGVESSLHEDSSVRESSAPEMENARPASSMVIDGAAGESQADVRLPEAPGPSGRGARSEPESRIETIDASGPPARGAPTGGAPAVSLAELTPERIEEAPSGGVQSLSVETGPREAPRSTAEVRTGGSSLRPPPLPEVVTRIAGPSREENRDGSRGAQEETLRATAMSSAAVPAADMSMGGSSLQRVDVEPRSSKSVGLDERLAADASPVDASVSRPVDVAGGGVGPIPLPGLSRVDVALPQVPAAGEEEAVSYRLTGEVLDAATGLPIGGATVRLDMEGEGGLEAETTALGEFELRPAEVPDNVAVTAAREGYTPGALNVSEEELRAGMHCVFMLVASSDDVVAVEADPDVHHLGNDDFSGRINSQFQKRAEGTRYVAVFVLDAGQVAPAIERAELRLLYKGTELDNVIGINGRRLREPLNGSPRDGSFGEFRADIPVGLLVEGENTLEIRAVRRGGSDIDDFEFVNVRVHVFRGGERPAPRRGAAM
jgi:hypothetical protein